MASITGYSKAKTDALLNSKVPTSLEINDHPLSADITISKSDVGLGNVDNTTDADKPISDATQDVIDDIMPVYVLAVSDTDPSTGASSPEGLYFRRAS